MGIENDNPFGEYMATYEQKKRECERRMIAFDFTEQEWTKFNSMKMQVPCAYTNQTFVREPGHKHQPTVERIFEELPYSPSNCVWITKLANELKSQYIENKKDVSDLNPHELGLLRRIERVVESVENVARIQEPYRKVFKFNSTDLRNLLQTKPETFELKEENIMEIKEVINEAPTKTHNTEIDVAHRYVEFGKFIEQVADSRFDITYAQFKYMVGRKWCMLTKRELPSSIYDLGFFILDKTAPITKSNVFVTTKKIQESMDRLQADLKLTKEEIINIAKVLVK